ncbi:MAG: homoserine kinase, partial [Marinicella sp.]
MTTIKTDYQPVRVFAPVSIGNVSVGFDSLGLALQPVEGHFLGDVVSIEPHPDENCFELTGDFAQRLPADKKSNIVWDVLTTFEAEMNKLGRTTTTVKITLLKNIPVCSGLGSSACSVVAAYMALNEFYHQPFSQQELLKLMGHAEAKISGSLHYDNVAPCYLGGMQLMLNEQQDVAISLPLFDDIYWVLAYPDVIVSTQAARVLLPPKYDRSTLIRFGQNLAGFVAACFQQNKPLAFALLKDEVAEPYRAELLPDFHTCKNQLLAMD